LKSGEAEGIGPQFHLWRLAALSGQVYGVRLHGISSSRRNVGCDEAEGHPEAAISRQQANGLDGIQISKRASQFIDKDLGRLELNKMATA
jgi:hypothetical protein